MATVLKAKPRYWFYAKEDWEGGRPVDIGGDEWGRYTLVVSLIERTLVIALFNPCNLWWRKHKFTSYQFCDRCGFCPDDVIWSPDE